MRIYQIALFIVIFNFTLTVVNGLGIYTYAPAAESFAYTDVGQTAVVYGVLTVAGITITQFLFKPSSALTAFSLVFFISIGLFGATLSNLHVDAGIQALLYGVYVFVYIISLIQIGGGGDIES